MYLIFPKFRTRISIFAIPAMILMFWVEGATSFFLITLSAIIHELGHIFTMTWLGYRIRRIDILPMGALIVCPEGISDINEMKIALLGPIFSLVTAVVSLFVYFINGSILALFFAIINLFFGIFNLLPIKKSDGGKAISSFLSYRQVEKRDKICAIASFISKAIFIFVALLCVIYSSFNWGVILLTVAMVFQL